MKLPLSLKVIIKRVLMVNALLIILSAYTCKKDGDCHAYVNIKNLSNQDVVAAIRVIGSEGCRLGGVRLAHNESWDYRPYLACIERHMGSHEILEIYIVDINKYNEPEVFYDCDSISIKNNILKHYKLTKDTLIQSNFMITYQ